MRPERPLADAVHIIRTCSGLQTVSNGLANNVVFEPTIRENMRGPEPTLGSWPLLVMWVGGAMQVYIDAYV